MCLIQLSAGRHDNKLKNLKMQKSGFVHLNIFKLFADSVPGFQSN